MKTTGVLVRGFVMLTLLSLSASAGVVNLSTGLDASDNVILVGNTPDAHWTVDQPGGGTAPAKVVAPGDPGGAFGAWAPNGPGSSWITIDPNSVGNAPVIPYTYYRLFTLTANELPYAAILGTWGIDDGGEVRLNGNLVSSSPGDYNVTTAFSVSAGSGFFSLGVNKLTITMTNSDNFLEAVRLQATLTTPEPSAIIAAVTGIAFAGVVARRRQRLARAA